MLPIVVLVGRPNVGKSTIFNALTRTRDALVVDEPGVTRDRHYGLCQEHERIFHVIDTGGLYGEENPFSTHTTSQVHAALREADLFIFVADARAGLLPEDHAILNDLRRINKPIILAINKVDGLNTDQIIADFSPLGIALTTLLAASHRRGIDALIEQAINQLPPSIFPESLSEEDIDTAGCIHVAVIGRPNVGKSTLINRLLGEERLVASEIPGTTRDAIRIPFERDGQSYILIDTAGMRRRGRIDEQVEQLSVIKTIDAIRAAHVAVILIDAQEGVTDQDSAILGLAIHSGRAFVIAINKWDGLDEYNRTRCRSELARRLKYADYAEQVFISAKHGTGMRELMRAIKQCHHASNKELNTHELTEALNIAFESFQPPLINGRVAKMRFAHQGGKNPPRIILHGNRLASLPTSYVRYLENFCRKRFRLAGTPVRFEFREGENPYAHKRNQLTEKQIRKRKRLIRHVRKK